MLMETLGDTFFFSWNIKMTRSADMKDEKALKKKAVASLNIPAKTPPSTSPNGTPRDMAILTFAVDLPLVERTDILRAIVLAEINTNAEPTPQTNLPTNIATP